MTDAARFQPPRLLRNPHLQSVLGASGLRRLRGERALASSGATTREQILDGGHGVRLQGWHSQVPGRHRRGTALLLHGWEGSAESAYMRLAAACLLADGLDVVRLNFRDHGGSHHLNEGLFHSNRIDEIVDAVRVVAARWPIQPLFAAGYSLGGNFALRLALRAHSHGLPLQRAVAVCPLLDPARTMDAMEAGLPLYMRYFERKWRGSLARKRELFPQAHGFDDGVLRLRMRALTEWMVLRHTGFASLDDYWNGYSVAGERLRALSIPVEILMAADDPVIPLREFEAIAGFPNVQVELAAHGGHCGFIENAKLDGYAERWVAKRLIASR